MTLEFVGYEEIGLFDSKEAYAGDLAKNRMDDRSLVEKGVDMAKDKVKSKIITSARDMLIRNFTSKKLGEIITKRILFFADSIFSPTEMGDATLINQKERLMMQPIAIPKYRINFTTNKIDFSTNSYQYKDIPYWKNYNNLELRGY